LTTLYKSKAGRNLYGYITVRHRGGSSTKKSCNLLNNFLYNFEGLSRCVSIHKNNKSDALITLVKFSFGAYSYTILPHGSLPGDFFLTLFNNYIYLYIVKRGSISILKYFSNHQIFFNLSLNFDRGSQYAKAAGTFCVMIQFNALKKLSLIQLPTKKNL
jgi:large subunit ribosomal protein L2